MLAALTDATALLFTDWGRAITLVKRSDADGLAPGAFVLHRTSNLVVTGRELKTEAAGHRHAIELTALIRSSDLPAGIDRTDWAIRFGEDWFEIAAAQPLDSGVHRLTLLPRSPLLFDPLHETPHYR